MRSCTSERINAMKMPENNINKKRRSFRAANHDTHITIFIIVAGERRCPCKERTVQRASNITRTLRLIHRRDSAMLAGDEVWFIVDDAKDADGCWITREGVENVGAGYLDAEPENGEDWEVGRVF